MMAQIKAWADRNLAKFMSRKLMVWITSTVLLGVGSIESEHWVWVTAAYIGTQGAADIIAKVKGA